MAHDYNYFVWLYIDYIIDWFNEEYSDTDDRVALQDKIANGYAEDIATEFMNDCIDDLISQLDDDGYGLSIEVLPIVGDYLDENGGKKSNYSDCLHEPFRRVVFLANALFTGLVEELTNYLTNEFEVEI